jgi:hypothetical protein
MSMPTVKDPMREVRRAHTRLMAKSNRALMRAAALSWRAWRNRRPAGYLREQQTHYSVKMAVMHRNAALAAEKVMRAVERENENESEKT